MSEEGLRRGSKRPVEFEAVFGQLQRDGMFNRFAMRGIGKVEIGFGLLAMAHGLLRMMKNRAKCCLLCVYTKNWNTLKNINLERAA